MQCWNIEFTINPIENFSIDSFLDIEDLLNYVGMQLVDSGAAGTHWTVTTALTAYFYSDSIEAVTNYAEFQLKSPSLSKLLGGYSITKVPDTNWTITATDLLQPLEVGILSIIPVASALDLPARKTNQILIIPGMGFGTGHHPTTKNVIGLLQNKEVSSYISGKTSTARLLDFGTGSGLLAIAAQELYPRLAIFAVDNDPAAVENARENASLNGPVTINFSVGDRVDTSADIILANIYAEVLVGFQNSIYTHLSASGIIILSGIMKEKLPLIDEAFTEKRWNKIEQIIDDGWVSILFRKENI